MNFVIFLLNFDEILSEFREEPSAGICFRMHSLGSSPFGVSFRSLSRQAWTTLYGLDPVRQLF